MKVLSAECYGAGTDIFEPEILEHLRDHDTEHPGYKYISALEDSFTHEGLNGSHVCLIFKVMGESLSTFRYWFENYQIVSPVAARFATQLLQALDYAHTYGVIHTGMIWVELRLIRVLKLSVRHSTEQYHDSSSR